MSNETPDNIEVAMDKVAETLDMTRSSNTGSKPGEPAAKQVLVRASEADHQRWKDAAEKQGISMSEFVRECCNAAASQLLDCQHPTNMTRFYPWGKTCLQCGHKDFTEQPKSYRRSKTN